MVMGPGWIDYTFINRIFLLILIIHRAQGMIWNWLLSVMRINYCHCHDSESDAFEIRDDHDEFVVLKSSDFEIEWYLHKLLPR